MRYRVENMHREEDQAKPLFADSESAKEPVGDQRIG
jgi:hypothetical protein